MPLAKQIVAIPMQGGVDLKTDPKQVMPPKLLQQVNGVSTTTGRLQKRPGYDSLGKSILSGGNITTPQALAAYASELLQWDATTLYSYSVADSGWVSKGSSTSVDVQANQIVRNNYQQTSQDGSVHPNGIALYAWNDTQGNVRYSLVDETTHQIVANSPLTYNGGTPSTYTNPKVLILGGYLCLLVIDTANSNNLDLWAFNASNPTAAPTRTNLATANATYPNYDACSVDAQQYIYFAFNSTSGSGSSFTASCQRGNKHADRAAVPGISFVDSGFS